MKTAAICNLSITNPPSKKPTHKKCTMPHQAYPPKPAGTFRPPNASSPRILKPASKKAPQPRALTNHRSRGPACMAVTTITTASPTGQENQLQQQTPGRGPWNPARGRGRPGNAWPSGPSFVDSLNRGRAQLSHGGE